jgi:hypothetical protein
MYDSVKRSNPEADVACEFVEYDDLFARAPHNPATYAKALTTLLASGVVHSLEDAFSRKRGLLDIPAQLRWTAGMVAQWASDDDLRAKARQRVLDMLTAGSYDLVVAHSLGSLISYDTFLKNPSAIAGKRFISLGSQIGHPFVRDLFAGRILPLRQAKTWYHLYNPDDHVLTAPVRIQAENFRQVKTEFDIPNDMLNHDAVHYLRHESALSTVWQELAGGVFAKSEMRSFTVMKDLATKPRRRALLVGINEYPDPASRLEGCVNDVFLMSSVLQECGFQAEDIRVVLDDRATAKEIVDRLQWLLDGVTPQDERVFFYSGHGAQIPAYGENDEVDREDECLVPYDFDWSPEHAVRDKQFFQLYSQLPYESRFVAIMDCCHSGGMTREGGRRVRGLTPPDDIRHRALRWNAELQMWEDRDLRKGKGPLSGSRQDALFVGKNGQTNRLGRAIGLRSLPSREYDKVRQELGHKGPYLPIIFEACQEDQLASEYRHGVTSYGAFTYSLAQELRQRRAAGKNPTFNDLAKAVGKRLTALHYDQVPCLVGPKAVLNHQVPWTAGGRRPVRARTVK